jgi:hypothetical protein
MGDKSKNAWGWLEPGVVSQTTLPVVIFCRNKNPLPFLARDFLFKLFCGIRKPFCSQLVAHS